MSNAPARVSDGVLVGENGMTLYTFDRDQAGFFYYHPHIFKRSYLVENNGKWKGYPMRTWDGNSYRGGYSDHFPTYVILLKKVTAQRAF